MEQQKAGNSALTATKYIKNKTDELVARDKFERTETETLNTSTFIIIKNKPTSKSKKIAVECLSREPRLRRLMTTLTTPLNIHKTSVHQLAANSPIINALRITVKKP